MKKKTKKTLLSTLSVAVFSLSAASVISANETTLVPPSQQDAIQVDSELMQENLAEFNSIIGTIQEIAPYGLEQEMQLITVESADGSINRFVVSDETYLMDELAVGDEINAFYDANLPVIMIYPPQYSAKVIALAKDDRSIKVDRFDQELISADGMLKLFISDETKIIQQDGTPYDGELSDQRLVVSYDIATFSIPAQTTPNQIIVLDDQGQSDSVESDELNESTSSSSDEKGVEESNEPDMNEDMIEIPADSESEEASVVVDLENIEGKSILVNHQHIDAPSAYVDEQGVVMVPLRAIAEALGYEVSWNAEQMQASLGITMSLKIGEDSYIFARMAPIELGTAPALVNGHTYVPLSFFSEVVKASEAQVTEDGINIIQER